MTEAELVGVYQLISGDTADYAFRWSQHVKKGITTNWCKAYIRDPNQKWGIPISAAVTGGSTKAEAWAAMEKTMLQRADAIVERRKRMEAYWKTQHGGKP